MTLSNMSSQRFWNLLKALCFSNLFSLFLAAPRHPVYARSCQYAETEETEGSSSGSPQKSWIVEHSFQLSLPKKKLGSEGFCLFAIFWVGRMAVVVSCMLDQIAISLLCSPEGLVSEGTHRFSEIGEIEASSSGSTGKSWDIRCAIGLSPSSGSSWGLWPAHSVLCQRGEL